MNYLFESIRAAIELIFAFDQDIQRIVWTSLYTSFCAILLATTVAVPAGVALGLTQFRGRRIVITLLNTLMALPTVVVGLVLFGVFSRQGPVGSLGLLFTPVAMIAGQVVLATPIITNYILAAVDGSDSRIINTALTLGATPLQANAQLIKEIRFGVMAAIIAGFGRVIGEVGVAMMLGGNIRNSTRTMTTAIALETSKGEFAFGLALGIVLLSVALFVNLFFNLLQQR